jgi:hypothetical protein
MPPPPLSFSLLGAKSAKHTLMFGGTVDPASKTMPFWWLKVVHAWPATSVAPRLPGAFASWVCWVGGVRMSGRWPYLERRSRPAAGDVRGCWPVVLVAWAARYRRDLIMVGGWCQWSSSPALKAGPLPLSGSLLPVLL